MVISGEEILKQNIIYDIVDKSLQCQPCGVDLTLKGIYTWKSRATVDFDNLLRKKSRTELIEFNQKGKLVLKEGSYLIEFNEKINVPLDMVGQMFVRSSLFRNGCFVIAGIIDSGYNGGLGSLLQVVNPHGIELLINARICQCVISQMNSKVVGYSGVYQYSNISE